MRVRFTEALLRSARLRDGLPKRSQGYLFDTELPRFGVCVNSRMISFVVNLDGKVRGTTQRKVIGRYGSRLPDGSRLTLGRARQLARVILAEHVPRCPFCRQRIAGRNALAASRGL